MEFFDLLSKLLPALFDRREPGFTDVFHRNLGVLTGAGRDRHDDKLDNPGPGKGAPSCFP